MLSDMGPMSKDEFRVGVVFFIAAGLWMFRSLIDNYVIGLTDAGIAILVAIALFIIPSSGRMENCSHGNNQASFHGDYYSSLVEAYRLVFKLMILVLVFGLVKAS